MEHQSAWNLLTDIRLVIKMQKSIGFPAYNLPLFVFLVRFAPAIFATCFYIITRRSPRWAKPSYIFPFCPESPFKKLEHLRSTINNKSTQIFFSANGAPIGMKSFDWHPLGHEDAEKHWVFRLQPTVFRKFCSFCASYFCDLFLYYYRYSKPGPFFRSLPICESSYSCK